MSTGLNKSLTPLMLWGLGVGYVISGNYFGWNLGLAKAGTWGMLAATILVAIMYVSFSFSYAELACAIPKAGGGFDYARRSLGGNLAFITGAAQFIEFVFAPPAIAFGIGAYFSSLFPGIPTLYFSIIAYFLFTGLNLAGIKTAASFELFVTIIAIGGLVVFFLASVPQFSASALRQDALPNGWVGAFAALPFAIWFFLGIEGVANVAEESINPQRDISKGMGFAIITLVILCFMTFFSSIGIAGWKPLVEGGSDAPLPLALSVIYSSGHWINWFILVVGITGLIASFHGLIMAAGRATFELGRVGYLPKLFGVVHPKLKTPAWALVLNMTLGIGALLTGKAGSVITISVCGALTLYILSMLALIRFRIQEPLASRPFKVPFYPVTPIVALVLGIACLSAMFVYFTNLALMYGGFILVAFVLFKLLQKRSLNSVRTP